MTANLKSLSSDELLHSCEVVVKEERLLVSEVVRHFQEIYDRKLYLERGFASLFDMATRHFGYCAASAQRRINSMRLIKALPEVQQELESGGLTLTAAANLQTFFQQEAKENKCSSHEKKLEVMQACIGKSTRDVEKELTKRNPKALKRETTRIIREDRVSLNFSISLELEEKMMRLKNILSHVNPKMGNEELLGIVVDIALKKLDPVKRAERAQIRKAKRVKTHSSEKLEETFPPRETSDLKSTPPEMKPRSRVIQAKEKHKVWSTNKAQGCEFVDTKTGQRCSSRHLPQIDHVTPFSEGGANNAENLRVLCGQHNRYVWANPQHN